LGRVRAFVDLIRVAGPGYRGSRRKVEPMAIRVRLRIQRAGRAAEAPPLSIAAVKPRHRRS